MHENRETSEVPAAKHCGRTAGEGGSRTARVYIFEESDSGVIPMNHSNKDGKPYAENKEMKFTALLHHLTVDLLRESLYALKRKAAPGVDGVTWQEYETGLQNRL